MNKKVLLGMSGGVDSSVAATLLQKQGYEVIGSTMRLWEDEKIEKENNEKDNENSKINKAERFMASSVETSISDAKKVCEKLGIEHHVFDLREEFRNRVVNNFICTYMCAKTPNPCVECNKFMKFNAFYKIAKELGCEYIATGHYAKCFYSEEFKAYVLAKADAEEKDQSYFLHGIDKEILPHVIFPLSSFNNKEEIRKIAEENGLEVAKKKDSQEVCFIPDNDYIGFLKREQNNYNKLREDDNRNDKTNNEERDKINLMNKTGDIVLSSGEVLGKHTSLVNYTVGQRKGIGVSYKEPLYVLKLDKEKNEVIVGTEKELYTDVLYANELNFLLNIENGINNLEIEAKIRYRAKPAKAILNVENGIAKVKFYEEQRAITPGQSVVFYLNNIVLGGGKII